MLDRALALQPRLAALVAPWLLLWLLAAPATAAQIGFTLVPFTGDASEVQITLDDMAAGDGNLQIQVQVSSGLADIRGIYFDLGSADLLDGLMIAGDGVANVELGEVVQLARGANLLGGGSPCPCDVGVEIGLPGLRGGADDFQSVTLVLMHDVLDLDLSVLAGQSFGVRLQSVGDVGFGREGSSKLGGVVPEPSTGVLLGAGLALFAARHGRPRARRPRA